MIFCLPVHGQSGREAIYYSLVGLLLAIAKFIKATNSALQGDRSA
jgi:hypothetical protein